jgi:hypothetical protein
MPSPYLMWVRAGHRLFPLEHLPVRTTLCGQRAPIGRVPVSSAWRVYRLTGRRCVCDQSRNPPEVGQAAQTHAPGLPAEANKRTSLSRGFHEEAFHAEPGLALLEREHPAGARLGHCQEEAT